MPSAVDRTIAGGSVHHCYHAIVGSGDDAALEGSPTISEIAAVADVIHRTAGHGPIATHVTSYRRNLFCIRYRGYESRQVYWPMPVIRILWGAWHDCDGAILDYIEPSTRDSNPRHGWHWDDGVPTGAVEIEAVVLAGWEVPRRLRGAVATHANVLEALDTTSGRTMWAPGIPVGANILTERSTNQASYDGGANIQLLTDSTHSSDLLGDPPDHSTSNYVETLYAEPAPMLAEAAGIILERLRAQVRQPGAGAYRMADGSPATPSLSYALTGQIRQQYGKRTAQA